MNRDEIFSAAELEGKTNVALSQLEDAEEIGIEQLRQLPGTDGMDDAALLKMWQDAQAEDEGGDTAAGDKATAQAAAEAVGGTAVQTSRGWKVYDDKGAEVTDIDKMSVADFLKHKIGYQANKSEQRKSIEELLRVAQYGHLQEGKLARVSADRETFHKQVQKLEPELKALSQSNGAVRYAFTQYLMGDASHLESLLEAFKKQMGGGLPAANAPNVAANTNAGHEGQRYYYEYLQPRADAIATKYGAKQAEVRKAVQDFINTEPNMSQEKLDSFIDEEIPMLLENVGYKVQMQPSDEVANLRKELAALKANTKNSTVTQLINKRKQIPGGGTGESLGAESLESPTIPADALKSAAAMKTYLRNR